MATIREDVVSISFDVENNPFADITAEVNAMKAAVTGGVDGSTQQLKDMAQDAAKAADGVGDIADSAKKLKGTDKTFTQMVKGVKDMAKAKVGNGLDKLKSIPQQAKGQFDKLKNSVQKIKSIKLGDVGKGLDKALGKGITSGGKLFTNLKKAAGVGFEKANSGLSTLAGHAGKAAVTIGGALAKGVVAGVGAAAGAVGGLVGASVKAYAEQEQLVGGVETLFKNSAPAIQKYANDAYKTSGLSANKYMETVTSFSASMIQSVGGDTAKAAELSDMAITDMSDNANKMGTSMDSIIETYQSLAKGNYEMLDNLKLGYGGTKTEMQRLIKDAAKIDSSIDANSMSYSNMVKAIHAVQDNMGITGTTAKEAEGTISGSLASLKAAWGNVLPALIQGGDAFDQTVENLVQTATTFGKNILPAIKSALTGVTQLIAELAPMIAAEIPTLVVDLLPQLVNAAISMVQSLLDAIQSNVGAIASAATAILTSLVQFILTGLPQLIIVGVQLIISLVQGIAQQLPQLIPMAIQAITTLVISLINMLPQLIQAGIQLIVALVQGLVASLPQLIPAGVEAVLALINGIVGAIPQLIEAIVALIPVIIQAIIQNLPQILSAGIQILVALINGLGQALPQLMSFMPQIISAIVDTLKEIDLLQVGKDIVQGLINGISSMLGAVKDAAKNVASGAANAIKGFLNINSPSKLMIEYGQYTGVGLAKGMQNTQDTVSGAATGLGTAVSEPLEPTMNSYTPSNSSVSNNNSNVTNNFNPQFTLNMNGASATESNKRKVKQWVKESIQETFESLGRTNPELCEV